MGTFCFAEDQAPAAHCLPTVTGSFEGGQAPRLSTHVDADRRQVVVERLDISQHEIGWPLSCGTDGERDSGVAQDRVLALAGDKAGQLGGRHIGRVVQRLEPGVALFQVEAIDEVAEFLARNIITSAEERLHGYQDVGVEPDTRIDLLGDIVGIALESQARIPLQQLCVERMHDDRAKQAEQQRAECNGGRTDASERTQQWRQ